MDGDVTVRVEWSTVNYKDGLAVSGKAPVVRRFPMIPGIDFVGMVESSTHPGLEAGRPRHPQRLGRRRDASRRLCREGARERRVARAGAARHDRPRGDGDRHRRLHRDARRDGAGAARRDAGARARRGHRRGRRRRFGCDRDPLQARLQGDRRDRPPAGGALPARARRVGNSRPQGTVRPGQAARQGALGRPASTPSARRRSRTCWRERATAASSRPAALRAAWTFRPPSRRSFCGRCRFWASTVCRARNRCAGRPGTGSPRTSTAANCRP